MRILEVGWVEVCNSITSERQKESRLNIDWKAYGNVLSKKNVTLPSGKWSREWSRRQLVILLTKWKTPYGYATARSRGYVGLVPMQRTGTQMHFRDPDQTVIPPFAVSNTPRRSTEHEGHPPPRDCAILTINPPIHSPLLGRKKFLPTCQSNSSLNGATSRRCSSAQTRYTTPGDKRRNIKIASSHANTVATASGSN